MRSALSLVYLYFVHVINLKNNIIVIIKDRNERMEDIGKYISTQSYDVVLLQVYGLSMGDSGIFLNNESYYFFRGGGLSKYLEPIPSD